MEGAQTPLSLKGDAYARRSAFKQIANVQLRGSTFDATHLDLFLQSEWGKRSGTSVDYYRH